MANKHDLMRQKHNVELRRKGAVRQRKSYAPDYHRGGWNMKWLQTTTELHYLHARKVDRATAVDLDLAK